MIISQNSPFGTEAVPIIYNNKSDSRTRPRAPNHGLASTLRTGTAISPEQWQP